MMAQHGSVVRKLSLSSRYAEVIAMTLRVRAF